MSDIKKEYDFSKAHRITDFENGKFLINSEDIETPIYLDKKYYLNRKFYPNNQKLLYQK